MSHRLALLLVLAVGGCGEPLEADGGRPDVPPPPRCVDIAGSIWPLEPAEALEPLSREAVEACGGCIEDHAVSISPSPHGSFDAFQVPLQDGVVIVLTVGLTLATFVTTDGQVIPLRELPYPDPINPDEVGTGLYPYGVPDSDRVWISSYLGRNEQTVSVLYRVSRDGWERLAAAAVDAYQPLTALAGGELLGIRRLPGVPTLADELVLLRPQDDGTVEEVSLPVELVIHQNSFTVGWPLADGRGVVHFSAFLEAGSGAFGSYVATVPADGSGVTLERVFVEDDTPRPPLSIAPGWAIHTGDLRVIRGGHVVWMMQLNIGDEIHYFINGMDPSGSLLADLPGLLLNPDHFVTRDQVVDGPSTQTGFRLLSSGGVAARWDDAWAVSRPRDVTAWLRPVLFSPNFDLGDATFAFPNGERPPVGHWHDGRGHAFGADGGSAPPGPSFGITGVGEEPGYLWTTYFEECPRLSGRAFYAGGAGDDGLWVVWMDEFAEPDGLRSWVVKAALIHSDGTFGW